MTAPERAPSCCGRSPRTSATTTEIGRFLGWLARAARPATFDDYDGAAPRGRSTTWRGSGRRSGSSSGSGSHTPPERVLGRREMPGARVVPRRDAELRRARAAPRPTRRRRGRGAGLLADPRPVRADLGAAARPGRPGPGRAARGSASAAATGWSPTCRTSRRRWSRSSPPRAWARSGRAARRSSAPAASSTGSARSSRRCCSPVAGYGYGDKDIDRRDQVAEIRAGLPTVRHVVHVPYGPNDAARRRRLGRAARPSRGRARVRAGAVRAPAVRAVLLRHHRASRRRSCTATAGSCSST